MSVGGRAGDMGESWDGGIGEGGLALIFASGSVCSGYEVEVVEWKRPRGVGARYRFMGKR